MRAWPDAVSAVFRTDIESALLPDAPSCDKVRAWARLELAVNDDDEDAVAVIRDLQSQLDLRRQRLPPMPTCLVIWIVIKLFVGIITCLVLAPLEIIGIFSSKKIKSN
jgi:hypothetical protein